MTPAVRQWTAAHLVQMTHKVVQLTVQRHQLVQVALILAVHRQLKKQAVQVLQPNHLVQQARLLRLVRQVAVQLRRRMIRLINCERSEEFCLQLLI